MRDTIQPRAIAERSSDRIVRVGSLEASWKGNENAHQATTIRHRNRHRVVLRPMPVPPYLEVVS